MKNTKTVIVILLLLVGFTINVYSAQAKNTPKTGIRNKEEESKTIENIVKHLTCASCEVLCYSGSKPKDKNDDVTKKFGKLKESIKKIACETCRKMCAKTEF
jgi:hypothetical protein